MTKINEKLSMIRTLTVGRFMLGSINLVWICYVRIINRTALHSIQNYIFD